MECSRGFSDVENRNYRISSLLLFPLGRSEGREREFA